MKPGLIVTLILLLLTIPVSAQDTGVEVITGEVAYTVGFLSDFGAGTVRVALVDQSSTVDRNLDPDYSLPLSGQFLGQVTSDPLTSPFTYQINLPIRPLGEPRDLDRDADDDPGVVVMSVAVFVDMFGDAYWEDQREYSAGLNSLRSTNEFDLRYETVGGKFIVWSPDDQQAFPAGYGPDGLIFTDDDPLLLLEPGYTVIDTDSDPFTFDRSPVATVDLIEVDQSLQPADYTGLSYTGAFDKLIDQMRREYAFTEYKNVDWSALYAEFLPRFQQAEADQDPVAYQFALQDLAWAIPDGHVGAGLWLTNDRFQEVTAGSLGIAIRELDDGRVIVNYLVDDSPAHQVGFELGTEILALDGQPITDAIDATVPWSSPFSTDHTLRLQQLRYVVRFPLGTEVDVTYQNPGMDAPETATLDVIDESESWSFSSFTNGQSPSWTEPIEFEIMSNGYGYVRINTFSSDPMVMLRLWEWMIDTLNQQQIPGLIIDMRWNTGGYNIYNQMAAHFFTESLPVGNRAIYYRDIGEHVVDPLTEESLALPPDGRFYGGRIAVLTSPFCSSACEFFSHIMTLEDRAAIVSHYPTAGLGGGTTPVFMPDGVRFQFTVNRAVDTGGDILFEGIGIEPTVRVPVTEETLFYDGDVLMDYAVEYLDGTLGVDITEVGPIALGDTVEGEFTEPGQRFRYTLRVLDDVDELDFIISESEADVVLRVYVEGAVNQPALPPATSDLRRVPGASGLPLILEIATVDDAGTGTYSLTVRAAASGGGSQQ